MTGHRRVGIPGIRRREKKVRVTGDINLIPRLKGIKTEEEPEDDNIELETPPGAHQSGGASDSDLKDGAGDLVDSP